ncbi:hypothetical protein CYY_005769 [Polysphondylium violaceum]|uniref:Uncharacterized protein n=1 Tax=Polysphondylium violaceum TaxID=133409 RepID=A0A8J4PSZ2_9MYCE|nr:hypothetical protein CYY_005769 [Polysphondylium violaceum]
MNDTSVVEHNRLNNSSNSSSSSNNNNAINKQKTSSRGLIDLLDQQQHTLPNDNNNPTTSTSTSTSTAGSSVPQLKRGSSYLINKQHCQPLKSSLNEWRTDFYPNLSYAGSASTHGGSALDEQQQQQINNNSINNYEFNLQDSEQSKKEEKESESLLQQRVKQWQQDIHFDIKESSKHFYENLPPKIIVNRSICGKGNSSNNDKDNNGSSNNNNSNDNDNLGVEDSFLKWRNQFNDAMDCKMKETKRSTKIIITSK